jgi:glycine/D-amino acid oxidase-like deaminating enzyme
MRKNVSPWLHQLDHARTPETLAHDVTTDVAIIGAGIAGTASAYFALKYTDKKVVMLERHKLAHGATGHNAGQIVSYFERGFESMVEEFGLSLAGEGQSAIDDSWELLDEMYSDASLDIPFSRFIGHAGLTSLEQVLWHLTNNAAKKKAGIRHAIVSISDKSGIATEIPEEYAGLYAIIPRADVLRMLETSVEDYVAVVSAQKGCINSALFCQEVIAFLRQKYADRFALYEHTPVHKVVLKGDHALIDADTHVITASRVVLCTNGFESMHIINESGLDIDAKYHHLLSGKIGFMSGYLEKMNKLPIAISYYADPVAGPDNSYFYLTRRPFEHGKDTGHNLISIGGPDIDIDEITPYSFENEYPEEMAEKIDRFVHQVYSMQPNHKIDYSFTWHGLMGYTKNRMRLIGPEPQNEVLLYNLGCNGVGILPSVYGGRKIARHIAGERVPPSIFDVPMREGDMVTNGELAARGMMAT